MSDQHQCPNAQTICPTCSRPTEVCPAPDPGAIASGQRVIQCMTSINANNSTFNVVHGDQYNYSITIINQGGTPIGPPIVNYSLIAHRIVQTTTTLKITNPEAIIAY